MLFPFGGCLTLLAIEAHGMSDDHIADDEVRTFGTFDGLIPACFAPFWHHAQLLNTGNAGMTTICMPDHVSTSLELQVAVIAAMNVPGFGKSPTAGV